MSEEPPERPSVWHLTLGQRSRTAEFAVHHDVQVLLGVGADVSGDGVQTDGGILERETHPRSIEPGQAPAGNKNTETKTQLCDRSTDISLFKCCSYHSEGSSVSKITLFTVCTLTTVLEPA